MSKISIVVPIYNSALYLHETLSALAKQSYQDLEIILVNDGSTDNSEEIALEFSNKDSRFLYFYQSNQGPSKTRNNGIRVASGKYLGFCDSDDIPDTQMYETLFEYLEKADADISLCDIFSERDGKPFGFPYVDNQVISKDLISHDLIPKMIGDISEDSSEQPIWGSAVRCLYRLDIIKKYEVRFPEDIQFAEDLVFTLKYLTYANEVIICDKALYFYRYNSNSLMISHQKYQQNMFEKRKRLKKYIYNIAKELNMYENYKARMDVSFRAYTHECIGNACRPWKGHSLISKYKEIKSIVNDIEVINSFDGFKSTNKKSLNIMYRLIKNKRILPILSYYQLRFMLK